MSDWSSDVCSSDLKEMNSTGTMIGNIQPGTPCGTNSEKKCRPWRANPTIRTVAKEISASIAVTVTWLVTVNGWTPGTTPTGIRPMRLEIGSASCRERVCQYV